MSFDKIQVGGGKEDVKVTTKWGGFHRRTVKRTMKSGPFKKVKKMTKTLRFESWNQWGPHVPCTSMYVNE